MPLANLEPTDTFDIVETKLDATIDKVNELDTTTSTLQDDLDLVEIDVADHETRIDVLESPITYTETTTNNGLAITASASISYTGLTNYYRYYIDRKICRLDFDVQFTVTSGNTVSYIRIPLPTGITKTITGLNARYTNIGFAVIIAPGGTTNYTHLYVNAIDDTTDGQYLQIKRSSDGSDSMVISNVATTLKGHIEFLVN